MTKGNGLSTRRLSSWIESYVEYTKDTPAPEIFRLWSAIGTLASALERRVWVTTANQITYPNMFILLVGRPGVGKSNAINPATSMLRSAGEFVIAPKDVTKASFLKWMAGEDARKRFTENGELQEYHSVAMHVSELGVFIRAHDLDVLSMLNELYDCPPDYENKRIYQGRDQIVIPRPQISILAGTQPGYLSSIFPAEAWTQGFMARVILIHSGEPSRPSLFDSAPLDKKLERDLIADLASLTFLKGEFKFSPNAKSRVQAWYENGMTPAPNFPRLETYNSRRILHLVKLLQISSASRSNSMLIDEEDFEIAQDWMISAERVMPDVFLEMAGKSDVDVMRELWHYAWGKWEKAGKKAVHISVLIGWLSARVPAWQADKILSTAVQAGFFQRDKDVYTPKPKNFWAGV